MTARIVDVAVIGDGPAGSALARACQACGIAVVLVGSDLPWPATYATWVDDLLRTDVAADRVLASTQPTVAVFTDHAHVLDRAYGVFDNDALRGDLRAGVERVVGRITAVSGPDVRDRHVVTMDDGATLGARLVVDATGWPPSFAAPARTKAMAWQTAFGVVLPRPPDGDLGRPTLMDFRPLQASAGGPGLSTVGPSGITTFCYALPVHDGWLLEETVLASVTPVEPIALLPRLAARLDRHPDGLLADTIRTEYVRIPMGGALPDRGAMIPTFGAAAGYVHPATGFSVTASLRAAPRVADAIGAALGDAGDTGRVDRTPIHDAVWTRSLRRTRALQDYGLDVLLDLDADAVRTFFGTFFDLEPAQWSAYLRIDASPAEIGGAMARIFRSTTWPMRRRLVSANPTVLARLIRP